MTSPPHEGRVRLTVDTSIRAVYSATMAATVALLGAFFFRLPSVLGTIDRLAAAEERNAHATEQLVAATAPAREASARIEAKIDGLAVELRALPPCPRKP